MTRLTIGERIILHLSRYNHVDNDIYNIPWDLTQDGIASAIRISRAHASIELKKLRESDKVVERQTHIKNGKIKRKSYTLTLKGKDESSKLKEMAENEGINIMPMLDMKRCDPEVLIESIDDDNLDVLGLACVLRFPVLRDTLPETTKPVLSVDVSGMVIMSDVVKHNVLSVAKPERISEWNSSAADYWLDRNDIQERLYHLVMAGRKIDAFKLIANNSEALLDNINDDLNTILSDLTDVPPKYIFDVMSVKIEVALQSGDMDAVKNIIPFISSVDSDMGAAYSADLALANGNPSNAINILNKIGSKKFGVNLRIAKAWYALGDKERAMTLLETTKTEMMSGDDITGLDEIYLQMGSISLSAGDVESAIKYMTKGLGVTTTDMMKKKIFVQLSKAYETAGNTVKAREYAKKAR